MIHKRILKQGNGREWIILLHGIGGSSSIWFRQISLLKKKFNVLMLDLPSHGKSGDIETESWSVKECVDLLKQEVKSLGIEKYHLMGVSLGSLLIHEWIKEDKNVLSAICVGSVIKFNFFGKIMAKLLKITKGIIPMSFLYKLCAYILLPKKNHRESRVIFIKESKKVKKSEFMKWLVLLDEVEYIYNNDSINDIKKYYISGEEDHMFLGGVKKSIKKDRNAELIVLKDAGHVCNIDKSKDFNNKLEEIFSTDKLYNSVSKMESVP